MSVDLAFAETRMHMFFNVPPVLTSHSTLSSTDENEPFCPANGKNRDVLAVENPAPLPVPKNLTVSDEAANSTFINRTPILVPVAPVTD